MTGGATLRHGAGFAAAAFALAAALAGAGPKTAPRTYTIPIANMGFGPAPSGLRVGDSIEWANRDIFRHTATARSGGFDVDLQPKAHARTRLTQAGVVNVYCRYHPGMTVKLTVAR